MVGYPKAPRGISEIVCRDGNIQFSKKIRNSDVEFIKGLGFTLIPLHENPCGWMHIKGSVIKHRDYIGHCIIYCSSGVGTLFIEHRIQVTLTPKTFTVFNDCDLHSFVAHTGHVNLLIAAVKQGTYRENRCNSIYKPTYIKHSY